MTDAQLSRFIHPEAADRLSGGLRLRLAFLSLLQEVCPESDDATLLLDHEFDDLSGVRVNRPPARFRWPGWPRAFQAKQRLGEQIILTYPECKQAAALFFRDGKTIGLLMIPIPGVD